MLAFLTRSCLAGAAACLCLTPLSSAQSRDSKTQEKPKAATSYVREMRYLDSDADRKIDAKELAAAQQMASMILMLSWDACDRDGDGVISFEELRPAADEAMQTLLDADSQSEQKAEEELARLVPLSLLLERLAEDGQYADELAALRAAVEDLDDDDAIIAHVTTYPKRYPPIVRTWHRYYPARPGLRRHVRSLPPRVAPNAGPGHRPKPRPKGGKPGPKRTAKPGAKPGKPEPKPGPKPKPKP
jgi:hypothetical protein